MSGKHLRRAGLFAVFTICLLGRSAAQNGTTIKAVQFRGNTVVSEVTLRQTAQSAPGQPHDAAKVAADIARIEALYAARGYTLARVRDAELLPDGTLRFSLVEGVIEQINITGNRKTRAYVIHDLLQLRPGMVYNEQIARLDRQRMTDLGIFETFVLEPVPSEEAGKVNLTVRVREAHTFFGTGAAAFSSTNGLVGYVDLSEDNLFGNAQRLRIQWQRGIDVASSFYDEEVESRTAFQISFDDPLLLPERIAFGFDFYHFDTLFAPVFNTLDLSPRQFQFREGATLRLGTAVSAHTRAFVHFRRDRVHFDDLPAGLLPPSERVHSKGTVASVTLRGVFNHRDRNGDPRKGHYEEVRAEFGSEALGGSFDFTKFTADARGYVPLGRGTLLLRLLGGIASRNTPLSEQFWIGGYDLLRGYDFDQFHGTRLALLSAEYRWPLLESIHLAVFADEGYAWPRNRSVNLTDMRLGGGGGLRFLTPIGAIRLDVAFGNGRTHTYLSLGQNY